MVINTFSGQSMKCETKLLYFGGKISRRQYGASASRASSCKQVHDNEVDDSIFSQICSGNFVLNLTHLYANNKI